MRRELEGFTIEHGFGPAGPDVWFIRKDGKYAGLICETSAGQFRAISKGIVLGIRPTLDQAAWLFEGIAV